MRTYIAAKLHNLTVTDAALSYVGSVTIAAELLDAAGIAPYEQLDVVNLATGHRWTTYALPGPAGVFTLNGGGARLGMAGDKCVVMTYASTDGPFPGARAVFADDDNRPERVIGYPVDAEEAGWRESVDGPTPQTVTAGHGGGSGERPHHPRVLELGSYVAPAYAGMVLAEQGCDVEKWTTDDPIHGLIDGAAMWEWINHDKTIRSGQHARAVAELTPGDFDVIIDNVRADTWARWGVDPAELAQRLGVTWVSLRADDDGRSFDAVAQARAWGDKMTAPFYLGDTAAGLWVAFKALAAPVGHHVVRQATCLAKLVEGELVAPHRCWDPPGDYVWSTTAGHPAVVDFKGQRVVEPPRDDVWRREHLHHESGRYVI